MSYAPSWSSENTARLGELIDAGHSGGFAARALHKSRGAVMGRARRLGWRFGAPRSPEQRLPPFKELPRGPRPQRRARPPIPEEDRLVAVSCRFDRETYAEIVERAKASRISRVAIVRELVEWGLEAVGQAEGEMAA